MGRKIPLRVAILILTPAIALPLTLAGLIAGSRPLTVGVAMSLPEKPSVFDSELVAWDLAPVRLGEWVEYDVACASRFDVPSRVRTRMACVGVDDATLWIESTDHILARFYPGTLIRFEVNRATRLVNRAWWGPEGGTGALIQVVDSRRFRDVPAMSSDTRARSDACVLFHADAPLDCDRVTLLPTPEMVLAGSSQSTQTWFSLRIPFQRRAAIAYEDRRIAWQGGAWRGGGVAREDFFGVSISMTSRVVAWGSDAKPRLKSP